MSYDVKCYNLAAHFIADLDVEHERKEGLIRDLAQQIQDTIEEFIEDIK